MTMTMTTITTIIEGAHVLIGAVRREAANPAD